MPTNIIGTARIVSTEGSLQRSGVRLSVCPIWLQHTVAAGLLLWAHWPADIDRLLHGRRQHQPRCSTALSSKCGQCHVASWRRQLNTDLLAMWRLCLYVGLSVCSHEGTVKALKARALTLLVGRQEGHPACKKTEWWGCWRGYLSGARGRLAYGTADATATHCLLLQ